MLGAWLKGLWEGLAFVVVGVIIPGTLWYANVNTTNASQDRSIFEHARDIKAIKELHHTSESRRQQEIREIGERLSRMEGMLWKIYRRDE